VFGIIREYRGTTLRFTQDVSGYVTNEMWELYYRLCAVRVSAIVMAINV
jgi:hypothetical protein